VKQLSFFAGLGIDDVATIEADLAKADRAG
jgi:hypothetical protein